MAPGEEWWLSQNKSHNKTIDGNEKLHLWEMMPSVTFFIRLFFQLLLLSQNARKYPVSVETVVLGSNLSQNNIVVSF